jgi:RNA polymerase sigma factor for flagellar operon FliA
MQTTDRRQRSDESLALWRRWKATGDQALRDRLVLTYAPLVKFIVYRRIKGMPAHVEVEDFLSCGLEALLQAIDRYDPAHGTTLEQFAWTRIHGAVLDEQRRADWAPRSVRRRERELAKAEQEFTALYGRAPTTDELAAAMGTAVASIREVREDVARADVGSLNAPAGGEEGHVEVGDTLCDVLGEDPADLVDRLDVRDRVRDALAALSPREREVAVLVYERDLTLREVADRFGVTESRVCQIHTGLKRKLRAQLDERAPALAA